MDVRALRRDLVATGAFLALVTLTPTSRGAFIITFSQNGPNVDAIGAGSLNVSALTFEPDPLLGGSFVQPNSGVAAVGGITPTLAGFPVAGPTSIGPGGVHTATSGTGPPVAISGAVGLLFVPVGYQSGTSITSSGT